MSQYTKITPAPKHYCGPNESGIWLDHWNDAPGTAITCTQCHKTWVAHGSGPNDGYMGVYWWPEGRWAAYKRRRKLRRYKSTNIPKNGSGLWDREDNPY